MQYDMEELLEQANEVQESLSRSYAVPDEIDEADLEAGEPFSCTESAYLWLKA
jgi:charged multivesicular body protein 5